MYTKLSGEMRVGVRHFRVELLDINKGVSITFKN